MQSDVYIVMYRSLCMCMCVCLVAFKWIYLMVHFKIQWRGLDCRWAHECKCMLNQKLLMLTHTHTVSVYWVHTKWTLVVHASYPMHTMGASLQSFSLKLVKGCGASQTSKQKNTKQQNENKWYKWKINFKMSISFFVIQFQYLFSTSAVNILFSAH